MIPDDDNDNVFFFPTLHLLSVVLSMIDFWQSRLDLNSNVQNWKYITIGKTLSRRPSIQVVTHPHLRWVSLTQPRPRACDRFNNGQVLQQWWYQYSLNLGYRSVCSRHRFK